MRCNTVCLAVQTALFVEPGYLGGQAPSHTLLSPLLLVTREVLPSILPLEGGIIIMWSFSVNASQVGGMEQSFFFVIRHSFTIDAPRFHVF